MKLVHVNVWRKCMACPQGKYILRIPEFVEKINASVTYKPVAEYEVKMFPTWLVVDDDNNVVARSTEIDIDKAMEWYRSYQN